MPNDPPDDARLTVAPDRATTRGHFPDRPIVPGVALLDAVWRTLCGSGWASGAPARLRGVRFLRTVDGGEELRLEASAVGEGVSFALRSAPGLVARGWIAGGGDLEVDPQQCEGALLRGLQPVDELLPHRPPMRLVAGVVEYGADRAVCRVVVPSDCPLARSGRAPGLALIEQAAQTAAIHGALVAGGDPSAAVPGAIVGLPEVALHVATVPVDMPLEAYVRLDERRPPLEIYRGMVRDGAGAVLAEVALTVVRALPPDDRTP